MRVLIVDDHLLLAEALAASLRHHGFETLVAATAREALETIERTHVDAALVDMDLPDRDGIWLGREMRERRPGVQLIGLSGSSSRALIRGARAGGFRGYLVKGSRVHRIVEALRASPARARWPSAPSWPERDGSALTARELEVLRLLTTGTRSEEIASRLGVRPGTVRSHVRNILVKLGARNRLEAVTTAAQRGLVPKRPATATDRVPSPEAIGVVRS